MKTGSLIVVGTGIRSCGQLTTESIAAMENAEAIFYLVSDPIAEAVILRMNPAAESLLGFYVDGKSRLETYAEIVERLMQSVREGNRTCAAFYGHPGVFVLPSHEAIRQARSEGYEARMLPGISAEDCLFADLGVDPADNGCQTYEATDFVMHQRSLDPSCSVIIWQIAVTGHWIFREAGYENSGLPLLVEKLTRYYPPEHGVIVYEAAVLPGCEPVIRPIALSQLTETPITASSTLYIPPAHSAPGDLEMLKKLELPANS